MKWLLWREYRLNRLLLMTGATLLLLPYAIALFDLGWDAWWGSSQSPRAENAARRFEVAAFFSIVISQLTLALLGGNAIAGERADRSAEFLAYLPVSRWRRLAATGTGFAGVGLEIRLVRAASRGAGRL